MTTSHVILPHGNTVLTYEGYEELGVWNLY